MRARPASVFAWGFVYVVALALFAGAIWLLIGPQMQQALIDAVRNGGANNTNVRFDFGGGPVAILIDCAIFRALLRPAERSFASLRISGDELRVFVVGLVLVLLAVLAVVAAVIVLAVPLIILGASHAFAGAQTWAIAIGVVAGIVVFWVMIWASVRLSLAPVITFSERRIALFDSWRLTRGHFWRLVGAFLLAWLLTLITAFGVILIAAVACLAILAPVLGSLTSPHPDISHAIPFLAGAGVVGLIAVVFLAAMQRVIMIAPLAYVYRALSADKGTTVDGDLVAGRNPGLVL